MSIRNACIIFSLICLNTFECINAQNITIEYIGNADSSINLTFQYSELSNSVTTLNKSNRKLIINTNNPQCIACIDIQRFTFIYAEPNETIDICLNNKGLLTYSCTKSHYRKLESQFINTCFEKYGPTEALYMKRIRALQKTKKAKLSVYLDANYEGERSLLEKYYAEKKISRPFYEHFKSILWSLSVINKLDNPKEQNVGFAEVEKSISNGESLINVSEYRRCLLMYSYLVMKNSKIKPDLYNSLQFISTHFSNQIIIDYLLYSKVKFNLLQSKQKIDKRSLSLFYSLCRNKQFVDEIRTDFSQKTNSIFLKNVISKSGCKFAIIDFWASWCKPCLEEFPYTKKRIKEYPQLKYIFVSTDKSKSAWLSEMKTKADIFNSTNSFLLSEINDEDLLKKLKITTIPRFVLLNQKGEIVNSDLPRPSDPNFKAIIDNVLKLK